MARKQSLHLTDAELRLMEVLWNQGSGTVTDVLEALPPEVALAYSTVLTTLRILEKKGYLTHEKDSRAFVYKPAVGRDQAKESAVANLVHRFFNGSAELLMLNLVEGRKLNAKQLRKLRDRIGAEED